MKKAILGCLLALGLSVMPASVSAYMTGTNTEGGMYVENCEAWISLRARATEDSEALAHIPLGAKVTVLDDGDPCYNDMIFAHIVYGGQTGYALYEYLTPHWTMYRVANCEDFISLRDGPSVNANRIAKVPLGELVRFVKEDYNYFYLVAYKDQLGYVLSYYLE